MEEVNGAAPGWSAISLPLEGAEETGDVGVVKTIGDSTLVAVVDALGHGPAAARTAEVAVRTLMRYAGEGPERALARCNQVMLETRGAAISIAYFDRSRATMSWIGVGNVMGALVRGIGQAQPRVTQMMVHGGVVGLRLPELRMTAIEVAPGDTLVLATDGIRADFLDDIPGIGDPNRLARHIAREFATGNDDAYVLVYPCELAIRSPRDDPEANASRSY